MIYLSEQGRESTGWLTNPQFQDEWVRMEESQLIDWNDNQILKLDEWVRKAESSQADWNDNQISDELVRKEESLHVDWNSIQMLDDMEESQHID